MPQIDFNNESVKDPTTGIFTGIGQTRINLLKEVLEDFCIDLGPTNNTVSYKNYLISNPITFSVPGMDGFSDLEDFTFSGNEGNAADVCKACYTAFINAGATPAAAQGILANIAEESGFNPRIVTWDGSVVSGKFGVGGGLCGFYYAGALPALAKFNGWSQDKLNKYNEMIKNSGLPKPNIPCHPANSKHIMSKFGGFPFSLQQQLNYLVALKEFKAVKNYQNPRDAAYYWIKYYEKPRDIIDRWAKNGQRVIKLLSN